MPKKQSSIKQKIIFGYYLIPILIVGLLIFVFVDLHLLKKRIMFGETISEFFDTTLEIRRYEKNYFLYHQEDEALENLNYVIKALTLLSVNGEGFNSIAQPQAINELENNLAIYKVLMGYYAEVPTDAGEDLPDLADEYQPIIRDKTLLETRIRKIGQQILSVAEDISSNEHKNLKKILDSSQKILIVSIVVLSLLGLLIGQILSRMIVRSLSQLEQSLEGIAVGKFEKIEIHSKDREIVSLTNAVNRMLRELELRQRHLVQSEKLASLGTLLSGVAHELNNPLSNISTSSQILSEEIEETDLEYKKELLSQIEEQTDRAKKIVRSLLEFSRDKDFKKEKLQLKALFEETLQFLKGQVPSGIVITLEIPGTLIIYADKQRIQQAFLNLIKNGIESVEGEGNLFITAQKHSVVNKFDDGIYTYRKYIDQCSRRENTVGIKIKDTGSGIPPEVLPHIFDPFFSTKDVGKGSGLGLSIVHDIIDEHHGCIGVESLAGEGTTFLIRMPIREI
jgi:two-component system NtrC family sensor kinase